MLLSHVSSRKNKSNLFWLVFFILLLLMLGGTYLSLRFSHPVFSQEAVLQTLAHPFRESKAQNILIDLRLPRILAAMLVGAALAVSGAVMQGVTRNAIADPGLLGINAGAGLALICGYAFFGSLHYSQILLFCLLGAAAAAFLVFLLAYHPRKGFEQLRLVLAGAMIATFLTAIGQGLTLAFNLSNAVIGWQAGGLLGTNWAMLSIIAPFILTGLLLAQFSAHQLTILSLNETLAKGLGQKTNQMTYFFMGIVLLLSGAAVALVGSLALVGLIIPHLVKSASGKDYRKVLPLTALSGSLFLLVCDLLASHLAGTPLSAIISLLTLPVFLWLMRKGIFYEK